MMPGGSDLASSDLPHLTFPCEWPALSGWLSLVVPLRDPVIWKEVATMSGFIFRREVLSLSRRRFVQGLAAGGALLGLGMHQSISHAGSYVPVWDRRF